MFLPNVSSRQHFRETSVPNLNAAETISQWVIKLICAIYIWFCVIPETEYIIIYQSSQPKMTFVKKKKKKKSSTAVHSGKDCDKELHGLGNLLVDIPRR